MKNIISESLDTNSKNNSKSETSTTMKKVQKITSLSTNGSSYTLLLEAYNNK
jgi:hypothetical protein